MVSLMMTENPQGKCKEAKKKLSIQARATKIVFQSFLTQLNPKNSM
jgi:hypothetical protein